MEVGARHDGLVTHLPRTPQGHDAVWVIMDQLTKLSHFLSVQMTFILERFCRLYIREIARLHGVQISIVSDRDLRLTAHFPKGYGHTADHEYSFPPTASWSVIEDCTGDLRHSR